jgi:nitric oxide reductase NorE protein
MAARRRTAPHTAVIPEGNWSACTSRDHPAMTAITTALTAEVPAAKRLPGYLVIWAFILAEMLLFAVLFASYAFARANDAEMFNLYQQTLDRNAGAINTLLLVTGSWFVVLAVQAAYRDDNRSASRNIALGFLCGAGFLAIKVFEYAAKFGEGISFSTNTFYRFYFSLTFFHFMHVILGMVILAILWVKTREGAYGSHDAHGLESGAAYWHMVDLLWIVLFPLVYVMR